MKINNTELTIKASIIEDGLVEQIKGMIERNPRLFDNETIVLMADTHKTSNDINTDSVPVGFTMTLSKGLIPVDYVSADMFCGVTGIIIKDFVPTKRQLMNLKTIARDILPVNRRVSTNLKITDRGTLGGGNHFVEIGVNGGDTLISVHSGSRNFGGDMFKKHKQIAIEHTKAYLKEVRVDALAAIEPKDRQEYLKSLPNISSLPLLDLANYPAYWDDLEEARKFAQDNRIRLLFAVSVALGVADIEALDHDIVESVHNFVDNSGSVPIVRKGSISAVDGMDVIIPINMRDGTIVGAASLVKDANSSLPHGAGRILSRGNAFRELELQDFIEDMKDIISPTVQMETLDESPRAYKPIDVVMEDISPFMKNMRVFKPVFNYKGV